MARAWPWCRACSWRCRMPLNRHSETRSPVSVRGQRGRGMGGHSKAYEGDSVEWYPPPGIFEALGLEFDLDPCAPPGGLPWIPAKRFLSIEDDGLTQPWEGR